VGIAIRGKDLLRGFTFKTISPGNCEQSAEVEPGLFRLMPRLATLLSVVPGLFSSPSLRQRERPGGGCPRRSRPGQQQPRKRDSSSSSPGRGRHTPGTACRRPHAPAPARRPNRPDQPATPKCQPSRQTPRPPPSCLWARPAVRIPAWDAKALTTLYPCPRLNLACLKQTPGPPSKPRTLPASPQSLLVAISAGRHCPSTDFLQPDEWSARSGAAGEQKVGAVSWLS